MPSCLCSCPLCIKSQVCCSDCWKLRRQLEAATTAGSCSDSWKLRRQLEAAVTAGSCDDSWKLRRQLEAAATAGSCDDSWKLRRVAGEASNMTEDALSILIVIFSAQLQQTKISERKLFIFHLGEEIHFQWPKVYFLGGEKTHQNITKCNYVPNINVNNKINY